VRDFAVSLITVTAPLAVAVVVFSQGLGISPSLVVAYFKERPALILRSLLAAIVLVPVAALAIILMLKPSPALTVGLAILVSCPPAPLMVSTATSKGGANAVFLASLHLSLAALGFFTVPAVLFLLSRSLGFSADVHLGTMTWILGRSILIPISLGLAARAFYPALADRVGPVLGKAGNLAVLVLLVLLAVAFLPILDLDRWSVLVIAAVTAAALTVGHLLGPDDAREKTVLAIECGSRHPALALAIGVANFGAERMLPVLIPCILTSGVVALAYLAWRRRLTR
jgi:BASS family bile acid:Na+ symporter